MEYLNDEIKILEEALEGMMYIINKHISDVAEYKKALRQRMNSAKIVTKKKQ